MDLINRVLLVFVLLVYPPYLYVRIGDDLAHPERWGDPLHNPTVTFLVLGALGLTAVVLGCCHLHLLWSIARRQRLSERETLQPVEQPSCPRSE